MSQEMLGLQESKLVWGHILFYSPLMDYNYEFLSYFCQIKNRFRIGKVKFYSNGLLLVGKRDYCNRKNALTIDLQAS